MAYWISGSGAVSCLGLGKEELFSSLVKKKSGIDSRGLGEIKITDREKIVHSLSTKLPIEKMSVPLQISLFAAQEALVEAGWGELTSRDGVILATTTGQIPLWDRALEQFYKNQIAPEDFKSLFKHYPLGTTLDDFSLYINAATGSSEKSFCGPRTLVATACGASTQALAMACMWLETGKVDRCLVGGVEVLCDLTIEGFRSLKLLSEERARPFDVHRTGINLSEASAFICLEKKHKDQFVKICGYGLATDSYHMTSPHPEGEGSYLAMKQSLARAGIDASEVGWVHAHGTGSHHNDLAEGIAIERVFEHAAPFVSSTKWYHGHSLGASGILESVISIEGLKRNRQVASMGLQNDDPKIPLKLSREHGEKTIQYILKNTLGFGGVNACVLLGKNR